MSKAYRHKTNTKYVSFYCPGCKHEHTVNVEQDGEVIPWGFNGDLQNPKFTPSVLCYWPNNTSYRCHSFVTNGHIQFLDDCTHDLKNQTVELPNRYNGQD